MAKDRTSLLIIRAWIEAHPTSPLRVTIRSTTDVDAGFDSTVSLADGEAVLTVVRSWLEDIQASIVPPPA
ncbi:MAG: hypothetical protein C4558_00230 [Dehalococcoidia bacterium]|nr:MAG: hypothetical protein C4558_00230 [Dehalococcoidia bacterium]